MEFPAKGLKVLKLQEWIVLVFGAFVLLLRRTAGVEGFPLLKLTSDVLLLLLSQAVYIPFAVLSYAKTIPGYEALLVIAISAFIIYNVEKRKPVVRAPKNLGAFVRAILPLAVLVVTYDSLTNYHEANNIVHILNPKDYSGVFNACDLAVFGSAPSLLLEPIVTPFLTELMFFAYGMHMVFPVILAYVLSQRGKTNELDEYMLAVVLLVCAGVTMYFIFPGISPAYVLEYKSGLSGGAITKTLEEQIDRTRSAELDCCVFPSVHVALSLLVLLYALKYARKTGYALAPLIILSWVSTVYLRRHYAVDALAGIALAVIVYYLTPAIHDWWRKRNA